MRLPWGERSQLDQWVKASNNSPEFRFVIRLRPAPTFRIRPSGSGMPCAITHFPFVVVTRGVAEGRWGRTARHPQKKGSIGRCTRSMKPRRILVSLTSADRI